jgi:5-methyltetrahydrofolate--homocysteine methyltransferase
MGIDLSAKLTRQNFSSLPALCTDGAWGTEMAKLGAQPGEMCDEWNVTAPDKVFSVAKSYVDAGAQIILTNTFNSNCFVLAKHGMEKRVAEFSKAGAEISKRAAQGRAYVFASIGPCGKMVMMGEASPEEVEAMAAEQAAALAAGGADAIVVETQTDLMEAEAALRGCLKACDLPVGVSFTFDAGVNNDHTMMGAGIPEAYELAKAGGASFVGANCGAGIETFANIAKQFAACGTDLPIWIKGNAGKAELGADGKVRYHAGPELYRSSVAPLLAAGARFVGGCCGSSPEHIQAVAAVMRGQR